MQRVDELVKIERTAIMKETGPLPDTHIHCVNLAEITLQMALEDYSRRKRI